jgi:hypothetical protein
MILLGGTLGIGRSDLTPQIDAFASSMRVVAPDRRGYVRTQSNTATAVREWILDPLMRQCQSSYSYFYAVDHRTSTGLGKLTCHAQWR